MRVVAAAVELEGKAAEGEDRVADGGRRAGELVDQDARGRREVGARGRGDLLRRLLLRLRLPEARLEEGGVEGSLQLRVAEGVHVRGGREEAKEERHAQVRHGQVLQQQLALARAQRAVKRGQHAQVEHILLGVDLDVVGAQLGAEEGGGICRGGRRARLVGEAEQSPAHAREEAILPLGLRLLLQRGGREAARAEARDDEALVGAVAPRERGVEGHPREDLGERLDRRHHQQLEDEDDVAEEAELGEVFEDQARLAREIGRQQGRGGRDREGRVQAELAKQRRVALGEVHRHFKAEDEAALGHELLDGGEVVEDLRARRVQLGRRELQVLGLDGEVADVEAEGSAGARTLARVGVTEQRGHVRGAHAHDRVGERREARDDDEAHGVKGARHADGEGARREVAADHREEPQQVGLRLVAHRLRGPEALGLARGVRGGQRQRDDGGDEVLDHRDPDEVRVRDVSHLVGERLAQLHGVAQRDGDVVQRLDRVGDARELDGQHDRWHLSLARQVVDRSVLAKAAEEREARRANEALAGLELDRGRRGEGELGAALAHEALRRLERHAQAGRVRRRKGQRALAAVRLRGGGGGRVRAREAQQHRVRGRDGWQRAKLLDGDAQRRPAHEQADVARLRRREPPRAEQRLERGHRERGVREVPRERRVVPAQALGRGARDLREGGRVDERRQERVVHERRPVGRRLRQEEHAVEDEPEAAVDEARARHASEVDGGRALHAAGRRVEARGVAVEAVPPVAERHVEVRVLDAVQHEHEGRAVRLPCRRGHELAADGQRRYHRHELLQKGEQARVQAVGLLVLQELEAEAEAVLGRLELWEAPAPAAARRAHVAEEPRDQRHRRAKGSEAGRRIERSALG